MAFFDLQHFYLYQYISIVLLQNYLMSQNFHSIHSRVRSFNFDAFSKPFTVTQFPLYKTGAISTAFRDRSLTVVCISAWLFSLHSRLFHRLAHYQQYQSRTISTVLESHNCSSAVICITVLASTEQSTLFKLAYHTASTEC